MARHGNGDSRRGFLKRGLAMGGGLALGVGGAGALSFGGANLFNSLARAAGPTPDSGGERYFIFCYFSGGWDTQLGIDPKDPAVFHEGNLSEFRIQPGWDYLTENNLQMVDVNAGLQLGPFIGDLGTMHGDKLCVIRGMSHDTLTHEVGRRRFLTGRPPSGLLARGSSVASYLAAGLGPDQPVPNLAVRVESYNVDLPTYASGLQVLGVNDLVTALSGSKVGLAPLQDAQLDAVMAQFSECKSVQASAVLRAAEEGRRKAREMVHGGFAGSFAFKGNTPEMLALRDHYGFNTGNSATTGVLSPAGRAALAVTAITSGLSRVVSVQVASGLDTHFNDWTNLQGPRQRDGFNAIARMVEDLASRPYGPGGESWLDHTTIIGFSEFSRSAMLNANLGRDHALTNACFMLGAGIKPGVIGASSNVGIAPTATDLITGQSDLGGEVVKPEHVMRALFEDVGITDDIADLRVDPLRAALKNG